jgi:hypothetical protein
MVQVGDKVRFLNDVGGGMVTSIINSKLVNVENEDGFEIPTLVSELIVVESSATDYEIHKPEQSAEPPAEKMKEVPQPRRVEGKEAPSFYLAFVPRDPLNPVESEIEAWLVNDSNFTVLFHYSHKREESCKSIVSDTVPSNSNILLEKMAPSDLSDLPALALQLIYFTGEAKQLYPPVLKEIRINPVKFYRTGTFAKNDFFETNAWLIPVLENQLEQDTLSKSDIQQLLSMGEPREQPGKKPGVRQRDQELVEVDLHIHELIDPTSGLTNQEILEIQLDRFKTEMEQAIRNRVKRIVFIHGVGKGTLKTEILNALKKSYRKYYVQDASFQEYGYGATMVILRK